MKEFNVNNIRRLVNYGRLDETTQYPQDFGSQPGNEDVSDDYKQINQMGDNPMRSPKIDEDVEFSSIQLSKLHHLMNGMGILDSDIAMGEVTLTPEQSSQLIKVVTGSEMEPMAAQTKIMTLVDELGSRIMGNDDPVGDEAINEFMDVPTGSRFTYVVDSMGTVNVYDGDEGTAVSLQGSDALELIAQLDQADGDDAKIQEILSQYQHVMEGTTQIAEGPEVETMVARLSSMADELANIISTATSTPATNVADWYKQNMAETELEKIQQSLLGIISALQSQ